MRKSTFKDMTGSKFGRLTVIRFAGRKGKRIVWECRCDCGERRTVMGEGLVSGHSKSCGCLTKEVAAKRQTTHGGSGTPTHQAWKGMRARCLNPKHPKYPQYGGRGISISPLWDSFENFLADMGPRPKGKQSIDRYPDNNGNYEPGNCRWATSKQQARNRRVNKFSEEIATEAKKMRACGKKLREIAAHFGTTIGSISNIIYKGVWA